jgi:F0F1-type ATP synthase membrane subunit b/b'
MDQNSLLTIMTVFVVIAGLALLVQMAVMIGLYRATRHAEKRIGAILPQVEQLVHVSQTSIEQVRTQLLDVTGKTSEILSLAHVQVARVDEVLADATQRARVQLERAEMVIEDTLSRAQQTIGLVHSGIMRPLREVQGITAGVRAALAFLAKGTRSNVNQITHDEEMFI